MLLAESARPLTDAHLFFCAKSRVRLRAPPAGALGVPPGGRAGTRTEGLVSWELAQAGGGRRGERLLYRNFRAWLALAV